MVDIGTVAAIQHVDRGVVLRVDAQLLEDGLGRTALLGRGRGDQLQGPFQVHFQHMVRGFEADIFAGVDHIGAEATHTGLDRCAVLRVFAQGAGQTEQLEGQGQIHVRHFHALEQAGPFGLGLALGVVILSQLDIRSVGADLDQDVQPGLRVLAHDLGTVRFLGEQGFHQFGVQIRRGDVCGQAGGDPVAIFAPSDEGAKLADAHLCGQIGKVNPAGVSGLDAVFLLLDPVFQPIFAQIKGPQELQPPLLPGGDVVQLLLHLRGEAEVHQVAEMLFQQHRGGEGGEGGDQLFALLEDVAPLLDGVDDGGVGAGSANAFGFQRLDQTGLGVPGRRLGLVADGVKFPTIHLFIHRKFGQQGVLIFQRSFGIVGPFYVCTEEAGEDHLAATGLEGGVFHLDGDGAKFELGVGHLGGHGALPDQIVERLFVAGEGLLLRGQHLVTGGADGLVGLLGTLGLGRITPGLGMQVFGAVEFGDPVAGGVDRLVAQVDRVGTHVGDETIFIELLGGLHGLFGPHAQLAVGFLLHGAGGEGGRGGPGGVPGFHRGHPPQPGQKAGAQGLGLGLVEEQHLFALGDLARVFVKISSAGHTHAAHGDQLGLEAMVGLVRALVEQGLQIPIAACAEGPAFPFPLHQQAHGHALHPPGGELGGDLFPEQGGDGVAHQPVHNAPGLLGLDQIGVDLPGLFEGGLDGLLGDLVEDHAGNRHLGLEHLEEMPADALTLPVLVCGQDQLVRVLEQGAQLGYHLFLGGGDDIEGIKVLLHVDAQASPGFLLHPGRDLPGGRWQIPHVAHAGLHLIFLGQEVADGLGLGG